MPDGRPSYHSEPDSEFANRLERMLLERLQEPMTPGSPTMVRPAVPLDEHGASALSPRRFGAIALGAAAAAALVVGFVGTMRPGDESPPSARPSTPTSASTLPPDVDASAAATFEGVWVVAADGEHRSMEIAFRDDHFEVVVRDWAEGLCPTAPDTATATARPDANGRLVLGAFEVGCGDSGDSPSSLDSAASTMSSLTYDAASDTVVDRTGVTWRRDGSAVWPQSTPAEVADAQRRADAGDPTVTWQLAPGLDGGPGAAGPDFARIEIFARFLRDELGWEAFRSAAPAFDDRGFSDAVDGEWSEVWFIRCAAGETNESYPSDAEGRACAPSSELENGYELVGVTVRRPARQDGTGIWVVTDWVEVWPYEQVVPPTDAEASAFVSSLLEARHDRFEILDIGPPSWPMGERAVTVRHTSEDGTSVTEHYTLLREPQIGGGGSLQLVPADVAPAGG